MGLELLFHCSGDSDLTMVGDTCVIFIVDIKFYFFCYLGPVNIVKLELKYVHHYSEFSCYWRDFLKEGFYEIESLVLHQMQFKN